MPLRQKFLLMIGILSGFYPWYFYFLPNQSFDPDENPDFVGWSYNKLSIYEGMF